MPRAYSTDLRSRVVAAVDGGASAVGAASRFGVSVRWVRKLIQRRRETGSFAAMNGRRGRKPKLAAHYDLLRAMVASQPDSTLLELREQLPVRVAVSTLCCTLHRLRLAFKKSPARRRAAAA